MRPDITDRYLCGYQDAVNGESRSLNRMDASARSEYQRGFDEGCEDLRCGTPERSITMPEAIEGVEYTEPSRDAVYRWRINKGMPELKTPQGQWGKSVLDVAGYVRNGWLVPAEPDPPAAQPIESDRIVRDSIILFRPDPAPTLPSRWHPEDRTDGRGGNYDRNGRLLAEEEAADGKTQTV